MSIILETFNSGDYITSKCGKRDLSKIALKLMEEVGELSLEITIHNGDSYKSRGVDGIVGEAIDCILCVIDIIHTYEPSITEQHIEKLAVAKLLKWEDKTCG